MDKSLPDLILCPACGRSQFTLDIDRTETIHYNEGPREEVHSGVLACACGLHYPIQDFVLSFAGLFGPELRQEAEYWDRFYLWNLEHGAVGFHDLKQGFAPFMANGVREGFPYADVVDRYNVHHQVSEHPAFRSGRTLLDIGVGLGWTSLHFARSGYAVTAFDPSLGPVQAAKAYAIQQGIYIEYLCAAVGHICFRPGSFDNVTAFHSLHHIPDLRTGLVNIRSWLRPNGAIAVDEHIKNSQLARSLAAQLHEWAEREVFVHYRTISTSDLAKLPSEAHSALEDAGADQVVPLLHEMFDIEFEKERHVVLDHYALLYYLWRHKNKDAYINALDITNHLQELLRLVDPDGGEYITIIGTNDLPETASEANTFREDVEGTSLAHYTEGPSIQNSPSANAKADLIGKDLDMLPDSGISSTISQEIHNPAERTVEREIIPTEHQLWVSSLENALKDRDEEVTKLREHLRRVETGRVMRILNWLNRIIPIR